MLETEMIQNIGELSSEEFQSLYESHENEEEKRELLTLRCATDLELFAQTFFPHYCTRPFNEFHDDYFDSAEYGERDVRRVRAAPRGAAKSTFASLIKTVHDVCYGLEKFILVLSSTTPLANKKLKDIRNEVQTNRALRAFYGVHFPKKKAGESEFVVHSARGRTYFAALGRGSEVRGIRINEDRPTKVVLDDIEYSEEVYNETVRKKTEDWFFEDIGKVGDTGTNIEFVGTVLHRDSLLSKLLKNPAYDGRVFKAIISWSEREDLWDAWRKIYRDLDDRERLAKSQAFYEAHKAEMLKGTRVLWPEKEDYLAHMKDMEEIGYRAFMKEKQNDPQGSDDLCFENFHYYREEAEGLRLESNKALIKWADLEPIAATDPATGQSHKKGKMGDWAVIAAGYKDLRNDRLFVHYDWTKRASPTKQIQALFEVWEKYKITKMGVETNLYRDLLMPNILAEKKRREEARKGRIDISFYDVVQTENKRERIYRIEPRVNHGNIVFNRALSVPFMGMFYDFPNGEHDDSPDCVEILWNMVKNRYRASAVSVSAQSGR